MFWRFPDFWFWRFGSLALLPFVWVGIFICGTGQGAGMSLGNRKCGGAYVD